MVALSKEVKMTTDEVMDMLSKSQATIIITNVDEEDKALLATNLSVQEAIRELIKAQRYLVISFLDYCDAQGMTTVGMQDLPSPLDRIEPAKGDELEEL
jgi:hypothetical protein